MMVSCIIPNSKFATENRPCQKERIVFQLSIFRCELALCFREGHNPLIRPQGGSGIARVPLDFHEKNITSGFLLKTKVLTQEL